MGRVFDKAIQTDCKISPQNYGGPLVDLKGEAMGVLTLLNPAIATEGEVEQWYDSGVGFAVPIEDILERLPILQTGPICILANSSKNPRKGRIQRGDHSDWLESWWSCGKSRNAGWR